MHAMTADKRPVQVFHGSGFALRRDGRDGFPSRPVRGELMIECMRGTFRLSYSLFILSSRAGPLGEAVPAFVRSLRLVPPFHASVRLTPDTGKPIYRK